MKNIYLIYQISDGYCVNAIVYDGSGTYVPDEGYAIVLAKDGAWSGWTYDAETGEFHPPVVEEVPAE